jgi:hypothetical protein
VFCCYRCANFAGGILPNRAALAADLAANLAVSSRRSFCFLNLLNLALSPFCDDICPRSSNLFVTQRSANSPTPHPHQAHHNANRIVGAAPQASAILQYHD